MTQGKKREWLIKAILEEQHFQAEIPTGENEQKKLLRALLNIRMPSSASDEFLEIQNSYLQEETKRKGITSLADLEPLQKGLYLWRGDITTLQYDGIVNAANLSLTFQVVFISESWI